MLSVNQTVTKVKRPVRVLQYGEGIFMRGFVEYMIDVANEKGAFNSGVTIVKAVPFGSLNSLKAQEGVYTVYLRGHIKAELHDEKRVITCVTEVLDSYKEYQAYAELAKSADLRFIVTNTTETGLTFDKDDNFDLKPPNSFPGKLTKFLFERFSAFGGASDAGLIIMPCELIDNNGKKLKEVCVQLSKLWNLPESFIEWLDNCNEFLNTLVDRVVTGYTLDEAKEIENDFGYTDKLIIKAEPFSLWVIETPTPDKLALEFPLDKVSPVIFTQDIKPYRERKVRLVNGAHTSMALIAYLSGLNTVADIIQDKVIKALLTRALYEELALMLPLAVSLSAKEVAEFSDSVMERFENAFIRHNLLLIAVNSVSKFRERVLPTIIETYEKKGYFPIALTFSFAALMMFYSGSPYGENKLTAKRGEDTYSVIDEAVVIKFFSQYKDLPPERFTFALLRRDDFWGTDLSRIPGFADAVTKHFKNINEYGMRQAVIRLLRQIA